MPENPALLMLQLLAFVSTAIVFTPALIGLVVSFYLCARRPESFARAAPRLARCLEVRCPSLLLGFLVVAALRSDAVLTRAWWLLAVVVAAWMLYSVLWGRPQMLEGKPLFFAGGAWAGLRRLQRCIVKFTLYPQSMVLPTLLCMLIPLLDHGHPVAFVVVVAGGVTAMFVLLGLNTGIDFARKLALEDNKAQSLYPSKDPSVGAERLLKQELVGHTRRSNGIRAWLGRHGHFLLSGTGGLLFGLFHGLMASALLAWYFGWTDANHGLLLSFVTVLPGAVGACLLACGPRAQITGGWLYLTDRRLVFRFVEPDLAAAEWSVPLEEIRSARAVATVPWPIALLFIVFRNGLRITTDHGRRRCFIEDPYLWKLAIDRARAPRVCMDNHFVAVAVHPENDPVPTRLVIP